MHVKIAPIKHRLHSMHAKIAPIRHKLHSDSSRQMPADTGRHPRYISVRENCAHRATSSSQIISGSYDDELQYVQKIAGKPGIERVDVFEKDIFQTKKQKQNNVC